MQMKLFIHVLMSIMLWNLKCLFFCACRVKSNLFIPFSMSYVYHLTILHNPPLPLRSEEVLIDQSAEVKHRLKQMKSSGAGPMITLRVWEKGELSMSLTKWFPKPESIPCLQSRVSTFPKHSLPQRVCAIYAPIAQSSVIPDCIKGCTLNKVHLVICFNEMYHELQALYLN